jgi:hypothetical protein
VSSGDNTFVTVDSILVRDSEPIAATIADNVVLLSVRAGAYFKLNSVGGHIWNMLVEPRKVGEILDALAQTYDGDIDSMSHDICAFLDALLERQLIRVLSSDEIR